MRRLRCLLPPLAAAILWAGPGAALETHGCRLAQAGLPAAFAECFELEVPLDYGDPDSPTIRLAAARVSALTATPAADPLLLINGGPGGSGIDLYLQTHAAFEPARRDRDIVLLDQRGTGRSRAGLDCDVPDDLELETATPEDLGVAVDRCLDQFDNDPRWFTTSVAVRDLERLRAALEVERWNIYGVSYGTRVAQHYLRQYPQHTRAVILDGTVPADLALGPDVAPNAQAALEQVFARCAAEQACAERFGRLDEKFAALRERFAAGPVTVEFADPRTGEPATVELGTERFQAVVRLMSYAAPTIALLPLVIDETFAGHYEPLAAQSSLVIDSLGDSLSFAMHNTVVCAEDAPFFASGAGADSSAFYLGNSIVSGLEAICARWPRGPLDEDFKRPLASDRPVLLLSGEYDPVTPPSYAERVAAGLTNAREVVAPGQGHGVVAIGCVPRIVRDFLEQPEPAEVATECLEHEPPTPFFLSFQGPAP
jgi:pimeloyl-ACP methyl ester carboxylesterase